jgi:hypothetical protein
MRRNTGEPSDDDISLADIVILIDDRRPTWRQVIYREHKPDEREWPLFIEVDSRKPEAIETWRERVRRIKSGR